MAAITNATSGIPVYWGLLSITGTLTVHAIGSSVKWPTVKAPYSHGARNANNRHKGRKEHVLHKPSAPLLAIRPQHFHQTLAQKVEPLAYRPNRPIPCSITTACCAANLELRNYLTEHEKLGSFESQQLRESV